MAEHIIEDGRVQEVISRISGTLEQVGGVLVKFRTPAPGTSWQERVRCNQDYSTCPVRGKVETLGWQDTCNAVNTVPSGTGEERYPGGIWCGRDPRSTSVKKGITG